MAKHKQVLTNYPGVYYIERDQALNGKPEKTFYIKYRKDGHQIFEKVGNRNGMTAAKAAHIRADRIRGKQPTNSENRVSELKRKERWTINLLWEEYKSRKTDYKGLLYDQNRFKKHIASKLGFKTPEELTPSDINNLKSHLMKNHKPGTVKNILELLRRIINFGTESHLCSEIKCKIKMPQVNNLRTEFMTEEEFSRYLEALENEKNIQGKNFLKLALYTGMRKSEILGLKWRDIDFERGFLNIRNPKGGKDQVIPMNELARNILKNQPRGSEYVFFGKKGGKRNDFKRIAVRIKKEANLPDDFRPLHGLRHHFASMLASSGKVDLYTLQQLLTHKSPNMTQRYAHLHDKALQNASNVISELMKSKDNREMNE